MSERAVYDSDGDGNCENCGLFIGPCATHTARRCVDDLRQVAAATSASEELAVAQSESVIRQLRERIVELETSCDSMGSLCAQYEIRYKQLRALAWPEDMAGRLGNPPTPNEWVARIVAALDELDVLRDMTKGYFTDEQMAARLDALKGYDF